MSATLNWTSQENLKEQAQVCQACDLIPQWHLVGKYRDDIVGESLI